MLFDSFEFLLLFLPLTFLGFLVCRQSKNLSICLSFIIFSSLAFHSYYKSSYTNILLLSLSVNYLSSHLIRRSSNNKFLFLSFGVLFNIGMLSYFKYYNFFVENINLFYNCLSPQDILLPLGISFYTFQQIGFLVDCYREKCDKYSLFEYFSYILFFPHLIAGPIISHSDLINQLKSKKILIPSFPNVIIGCAYLCIGLFKKVVISNYCAYYVDPIFDAVHDGLQVSMPELWFGVVLFSFVIYFDFSGYSDMAIGLARLFNIRFPINFDSPYKALNFIDFWKRWHITLSDFLKKYVYFSLGKNKKGSFRQSVNILFTMALSGLWHGANWNFIIWGLVHGFAVVLNHFWNTLKVKFNLPSFGNFGIWIARIFTFLCVSLSWVFFRAQSIEESLRILKGLFTNHFQFTVLSNLNYKFFSVPYFYVVEPLVIIIATLYLVWFLPNSQAYLKKYIYFRIDMAPWQHNQTNTLVLENTHIHIILLSLLGVLSVLSINLARPFIYFSF